MSNNVVGKDVSEILSEDNSDTVECSHCGVKNPDNIRCCTFCGRIIKDD